VIRNEDAVMYNVIFENSRGKKRLIDMAETPEHANKLLADFLDECNYKSYYQRRWNIDDKTTKIDVGSHTEFFYIQKM